MIYNKSPFYKVTLHNMSDTNCPPNEREDKLNAYIMTPEEEEAWALLDKQIAERRKQEKRCLTRPCKKKKVTNKS